MQHRLTRLRVEGMRTLEKVDLDLDGLRVLIGENGSGKSSILEALEILRRARSTRFWSEFNSIHGGARSLLRPNVQVMRIGCTAVGPGIAGAIAYDIAISQNGIESESARDGFGGGFERIGGTWRVPVDRPDGTAVDVTMEVSTDRTVLSKIGYEAPDHLAGLQKALENIEVHTPFDVLANWVASAGGRPAGVRGAVTIAPAERLERLGANLANVYQALRNERSTAEWETTMDWVRLGLGDWVESVTVRADASGGNVGLWVKHAGIDFHLPARALSDGQLQFLGLVALCRLKSNASIVAFDEPEAHLHPRLQDRAAQFFGRLAEHCPVLIATHSRRILDELDDPVGSVRVCSVSGSPAATVVRELESTALAEWMKEYDGLGEVLDAGYGAFVVREAPPAEPGS